MKDQQSAKLTKSGIREIKCQHNRLNHKECNSNWTNAYHTPVCQLFEVWKYFSIPFSPISKTALLSGKFPGSAHVSWLSIVCMKVSTEHWQNDREWYWQGKTAVLGGKPVPVALYTPQIPHELTWAWTWGSLMRGWRLTAWPMAWPWKHKLQLNNTYIFCSYLTVNTVPTRNANYLMLLREITAVFLWVIANT